MLHLASGECLLKLMATTPKVRNGGDWTEGRYRSFVTSAIRGAFRRWPPKFKVLKNAQTTKKINKSSGKMAMHYKCAVCKKQFTSTNVQVDHILPVVDPETGFVDWDTFIDRMFCEEENLQVVCKPCHLKKSKEERKKRGAK